MRCSKCPLYSCLSSENGTDECCGIFGDAWDSRFQYGDKDGTEIIGCYIENAYIDKVARELDDYYRKMGEEMSKEWL